MILPNLDHEIGLWNEGYTVIGIDEVGRGAFAGPVTVAGVIFEPTKDLKQITKLLGYGINDSKKLTPARREELSEIILSECAAHHISSIDVAQINEIGIQEATFCAMREVAKNLAWSLRPNKRSEVKGSNLTNEIASGFSNPRDDKSNATKQTRDTRDTLDTRGTFILVDGFEIKNLENIEQRAIIRGDSISVSIAAASIIAKVHRDRYMRELSDSYPKYGFSENKGYGTEFHRNALNLHGASNIHRTAFVKNFV
ncbi:MAG TPA: ribonuclease HII [Patescibacteria group bacterium]|nr:ribonuclease HII [Patescibacteria group bacterium]